MCLKREGQRGTGRENRPYIYINCRKTYLGQKGGAKVRKSRSGRSIKNGAGNVKERIKQTTKD